MNAVIKIEIAHSIFEIIFFKEVMKCKNVNICTIVYFIIMKFCNMCTTKYIYIYKMLKKINKQKN